MITGIFESGNGIEVFDFTRDAAIELGNVEGLNRSNSTASRHE
jgi:hypothetical protein